MPLRHPGTLVPITVEVQLTRGSGSNREHFWELRISDRASHAYILELQLNEVDISNLISSRMVQVEGMFSKSPVIGKVMEVRRLDVRVPGKASRITAKAALALGAKLAPPDEGWELDAPDVENFHCYTRLADGSTNFSMVARRYVEPQPKESADA